MFSSHGSHGHKCRAASHAGSWYTDNPTQLKTQLSGWIQNAKSFRSEPISGVCGVIAPHAGYSYSGPTAAYAYSMINPSQFRRVFVLGPSHAWHVTSCALPEASEYETPLGSLLVDTQVVQELRQSNKFQKFDLARDEREHSMEMHLPYIAHIMHGQDFRIVPILVGSLDKAAEAQFGQLLAPYLADAQNLFVISSDFCHWGSRFDYQPANPPQPIHETISALDHQGMALIEQQDIDGFHSYLKQTHNTICGRHPIAVYLNALRASGVSWNVQFVQYAQSSQAKKMSDSSVSYAAAIISKP